MKLSDLARKMITSILIIGFVCILASAAYYRSLDFLPFLLGVLLGTGTSIVKVFLLEHSVDRALSMDKGEVGKYVSIQHILRLLISGIVLYIGAVVDHISLWGVVAGIFAFQLALYSIKFTSKK